MKLKNTEINYKTLGKCLEITNGYLTLIISLEFGPRVLSFHSVDADNIFLEDEEGKLFITSKETVSIYGEENIFYLKGGHRMWVSPETWYTYYPDNDKVHYDIIGDRLIIHQPHQNINDLKQTMEIEFKEKNLVQVKQIVKNTDNIPKLISPWSITVMKGPGLEIIPMPKEDMGFLPQRHISIWAYGAKANDPRAYFGDRYASLYFEKDNFEPFKVGFRVTDNFALYMADKSVFVKRFIYDKNITYPDNNVNYETYTNGKILEMETVGELNEIFPEETTEHIELWSIHPNEDKIPERNSENDFDKIVKKFVEQIFD